MSLNKIMSKISMQSAKQFPEDFFKSNKMAKNGGPTVLRNDRFKSKNIIIKRSKSKTSRNNSLKPVREYKAANNHDGLQNVVTSDTINDSESKTTESGSPPFVPQKGKIEKCLGNEIFNQAHIPQSKTC
jgi:hypothetical protein